MPAALKLTAAEVAAAAGGEVIGGSPDTEVAGFSIDTRTLGAGDLYFALRGGRFDGEQFADEAIRRGAIGVVTTRREAAGLAGAAVVLWVPDALRALQALAKHVRRQSGARVVAITGSAGKTTTKETAAEFLATRYRVFRNRGNLNNHIGLPLSLLELRHGPEIAVVELGMNHAGEISVLTSIAEPEVRVWTNVAPAHLQFFESEDAIADAKAEILAGATASTVVVANADDERVVDRLHGFPGRVVTFGIEQPADVRATRVREVGIDGVVADVQTPAGDVELRSPLIGRGSLSNILAATAVGLHFDVPLADIVACAARLRAGAGRGEVLRLGRDVTVIDDSYNSNPMALRQALAVIAVETRCRRRVAVVGEMLELGERSTELHEECGRQAAASGLGLLVAVGGAPAEALARAASAAGMPEDAVHYLESSEQAADQMSREIRPGDLVLVKGSRGVRTDRVVERLKAEIA